MSIEFPCPRCGQPLRTPDGMEGQIARCPGCGAETPVPGTPAARGPDPDLLSYALGRVAGPVIALSLLAVAAIAFNTVVLLLRLVWVGMVELIVGRAAAGTVQTIVLLAVHIALCLLVLLAASRMRRLRNPTIARLGAITAMLPVPCLVSVCLLPIWLLNLWAGLWALAVLADPLVRKAFENSR